MPRAWVGAAPWCKHLGYAGDCILLATSPKDCHNMYSDLEPACRPKGLRAEPEKSQFWNHFPGNSVRIGGRSLQVSTPMVFIGAFPGPGRCGRASGGAGVGQAWGRHASVYQGPQPRNPFTAIACRYLSRHDLGLRLQLLRPDVIVAEKGSGRHGQHVFGHPHWSVCEGATGDRLGGRPLRLPRHVRCLGSMR